MKYTDLSINLGFHRNMRETNWLKLFPHWWSSNDPLIKVIGEEVERLKANAIFDLLNAGIKPPVLLWQNSLMDKEYHEELNMRENEEEMVIVGPRYKTWGKITVKNNSDNELYNFKVMINENDGLSFNDAFAPGDILTIDLTNQKYIINNVTYITPKVYGEGLPYFKVSQYQEEYDPKTKLHNEVVRLKFSTSTILDNLNLDIAVQMDNVVFEDEQNIEITSFELLPIEKVDVYVKYDFPYNKKANGWKKAYTKEYDVETHVIYDMITIHHYTKQFYVEVWFKGLDYPYQVGFPCWQDEEEGSMFHVNTRLDVWGEPLGLPRRIYKEDIPEEEYYKTFPRFYPFDIEQDFWYYSRLVNEYAWNNLAIDEADIVDTNDETVMRLHSINPFTEDFAIHARSYYPTEIENYNYKIFNPKSIDQISADNVDYKEVPFENAENILKCDNSATTVTLHSKAGYAINNMTYKSKQLKLHYDLSTLPKDINIDKIEIIIDNEATDNNSDKYHDSEKTYFDSAIYYDTNKDGKWSKNERIKVVPHFDSDTYELKRKKNIGTLDERVIQDAWNAPNTKENIELGWKSLEIGDVRDYFAKYGLDFNIGFTNEDTDNIPTIHLYCAQLKVYYSPKKSKIDLQTSVRKSDNPYIDAGILDVTISNGGEKPCTPKCYFFTEENIKLGANVWQPYDDLQIGDSKTVSIPIYHELPIVDGTYEILSICEDKKRFNHVHVKTSGLIETSTKINDYYIQYAKDSVIEAAVYSVDKTEINKGTMSFFVDGIKVGESNVQRNKAHILLNPSEHDINSGFHTLEARYIDYQDGDSQISIYAPSRKRSSLLIGIEPTKTTILSKNYGFSNGTYDLIAQVCMIDGLTDDIPVDRGTVTFYLDEEEISTYNIDNGIATTEQLSSRIFFKNKKAGDYLLRAVYNDNTGKYAGSEDEMIITLYGGETETIVFDIDSYPGGTVYFKAHVQQAIKSMEDRKYSIPKLYDDFTLANNKNNKVTFYISENLDDNCDSNISSLTKIGSAELNNDGNCLLKYQIRNNILPNNVNVKKYKIIAHYEGLDIYLDNVVTSIFNPSCNVSTLTIARVNTTIKCLDTFVGSQYEPLGFYIQVVDNNNEPVDQGTVKLFIPTLNIELESTVQSNGSVVLLYHPIDFTDYEWSILEKISFDIRDPPMTNLYRIYSGDIREDLNILDFELRGEDLYYKRQSKSLEQVWIDKDGHLYARTDFDDIEDKIRKYKNGYHNVNIEYTNNKKYANCSKQSYLDINSPIYDVDIHSYELTYNDKTPIRAWITEYNFTSNENKPINEGMAYFFIDGSFIDKIKVQNGLAILPRDSITLLSSHKHLISVEYAPVIKGQNRTYSYNMLTMNKASSSTDGSFNYILKDYNSVLTIQVSTADKNVLYGQLNIYMEVDGVEKLYDSKELRALIDKGIYYCHMYIPKDIDEKDYNVRVVYEGNEYVESSSWSKKLELEKLPVSITTTDVSIVKDFNLSIPIYVNAENDDDISEGRIILYDDNKIIAQSNVYHNVATLSFKTTATKDYIVKYEDGINYCQDENDVTLQKIRIIDALDTIYVDDSGADGNDGSMNTPFKTLQHAINCIKNDGEIHILDNCTIKQDVVINKKVTIIGNNNSSITKNLDDLLSDVNSLKVYRFSDFEEELLPVNISLESINKQEYRVIKNELYYINQNGLIPIYLLNDNKFYSYYDIPSYTTIALNIENEVTFDDIQFRTNDDKIYNDFVINNNHTLHINYCVIEKNIIINSHNNPIDIHYSLCYGDIRPNADANLSFNWWGKNDVGYADNIVLSLETKEYPPVIGGDFHVVAKMRGRNGRKYNIPPVKFLLYSDCEGYFTNPNGYILDQNLETMYNDATKVGNIYIKVDDEIVSTTVYDYDYKTEVILDNAKEVPMDYQVPICAKVQSCADTFYKFNDDNTIAKQSNNINDGYVIFYLDDISVGHADVINGLAKINIYFNHSKYTANHTYTLRADYIGFEHFKSSNTQNITTISEQNVCYVSPDGLNTNDGTFLHPVQSIQSAINLGHVKTIYLKPGIYKDTNLSIDKDIKIKKYDEDVIFSDNDDSNITIINTLNNHNITLEGLTFIDNNCNYIINNSAKLTIRECIFANNTCTYDILNYESPQLHIYNSVLLDRPIVSASSKLNTLKYCWFGTNDVDNIISGYNINDYITMDLTSNKENIYIGTVAHIKATLLNYVHNDEKYTFEGDLPLRISIFESDSGSLMPIHDYTHNNYSISLFNSNEETNTQQIALGFENTVSYYGQPLLLKCKVEKFNGNKINEGTVIFTIKTSKDSYELEASVQNGVAQVIDDSIILAIGTYQVRCRYENVSVDALLSIQNSSIHIGYIEIDEGNHLNTMNIYCNNIVNSLGEVVSNQEYNIYIDENIVYNKYGTPNFYIKNGVINEQLLYPLKIAGYHILTITTKNVETNYNILTYKQKVLFNKKQTSIDFPYNKIQQDYQSNLKFSIQDEDELSVLFGSVNVFLDNEIMSNFENVPVKNGIVILEDFVIHEKGRHTISIYYNGDTNHYESSLYIDNKINVGLYEVKVDEEAISNQLELSIIDSLDLSFNIRNMNNDNINIGLVNLYIDDKILNESGYINFNDNKQIVYRGNLPNGIIPGSHKFTIEYIDNSETYIDTTFNINFTIAKIPTQIIVDSIITGPNKIHNADYIVSSPLGDVSTGLLSAYIDDECIGEINLAGSTKHKIPLSIPLTLENKSITFYYNDSNNRYAPSEAKVTLDIEIENVNIKTSYAWYYPNKEFNFDVNVKSQDGKIVKDGEVTLYIDGVKETDAKKLINGYTSFDLIFDKVKTYPIYILFTGNEYYKNTPYNQELIIQKIPILNIGFDTPLKAQPNSKFIANVTFEVFEDYNISDGIVKFNLNGEDLNEYYMISNNKEIKLDIPNLDVGTYTLTVNYYDSLLFSDVKDKTFDFEILPLTLNMNMDDIEAELNDTISIECNVSPDIPGIIKYYMGVDRNNLKFIGIGEINKPYEYTLSKDSIEDSNQYIIVAKYEGNSQYAAQETQCNLTINKIQPTLNINPIPDAYYQSSIKINATTNIRGSPLFDLYRVSTLGDNQKAYEYLDSIVAKDGSINYTYKLPPKLQKGYYTIALRYVGSPIIDEIEKQQSFNIIPDIPTLHDSTIEVYKGNDIKVSNILYDINNINIKSGYLEYYYKNELVLTVNQLNQDAYIHLDVNWSKNNDILNVKYISDDTNKYASHDYTIDISYLKNDIQIKLDSELDKTRGEEISLNLNAFSKTTPYTIDVPFTYQIGTISDNSNFEENHANILYILEPRVDNFILTVTTEATNIFNATQKSFNISYHNRDTIYVSNNGSLDNIGTENEPTLTIKQALNLIANNGEIILLTNLPTENITINKNVTITGNNKSLNNFSIINNERMINNDVNYIHSTIENNNRAEINDCQFNDTSKIINNNDISITNCQFNDNDTPIEITNKNKYALIDTCTFNNNNSDLYGSAIYSNQGNELIIKNSVFTNNDGGEYNGSCIAIYGKADIHHNSFMGNLMYTNIQLLDGQINLENNVFDGNNKGLKLTKGQASTNMNYWGYNDYNTIISNCIDTNQNIELNTWLISSCNVEKIENVYKVYPTISHYYNKEEFGKLYNTTNIPSLIVEYDDNNYYTNQDYIEMTTLSNIEIGKQTIEVKYD